VSTQAVIGLGSNLKRPLEQVQQAISALAALPRTRLLQVSSLYRSVPMGPAGQPDYINAVAELETELEAHALLDALQSIEQQHGRVRDGQRWGARTLDLDILLYSDAVIADVRLQIPHPGMAGRNFVLYPLAEILPEMVVPGLGELRLLLESCPDTGLQRLGAGSESLKPL
jgi:2-amino-4-hydroxy-6-hydroxymethyldihydropteridine diphosphokinase